MFSKILIANRGEIAVRIIRACREMGISTVAIYSEADKDSLHVQLADESYCVGGNRVADSYLNMPAILTVAVESGAQAIPATDSCPKMPSLFRSVNSATSTLSVLHPK